MATEYFYAGPSTGTPQGRGGQETNRTSSSAEQPRMRASANEVSRNFKEIHRCNVSPNIESDKSKQIGAQSGSRASQTNPKAAHSRLNKNDAYK